MKTEEPPKAGWGILHPDAELSKETLDLIDQLRKLPIGQRDALITRAIPRYLLLNENVDLNNGDEPTHTEMSDASSELSNFLGDILGLP